MSDEFEYDMLTMEAKPALAELNKRGKDGWRAISVTPLHAPVTNEEGQQVGVQTVVITAVFERLKRKIVVPKAGTDLSGGIRMK